MNKTDEQILITGIHPDGEHFQIEKMRAHREGIQHLAISVFVFCGPDLLLQRRAAGKYHCAGQWANTCCSHPDWQEEPAACADRRLRDELGITTPLMPRGIVEYEADVGNGLVENERVHLFRGEIADKDIAINPNPEEVSETAWLPLAEIERRIEADPGQFTPWFRIYMKKWLTKFS